MAQVISLRETERRPDRCRAVTSNGKRCRNRVVGDSGFCRMHLPAKPERIGPFDAAAIRDMLEFGRRRLTGDYHVDDFGFDAELVERFGAPILRPLANQYWRVEWKGIENVPSHGAALLVANHAGTIPLDAMVMKFGVYDEHPAHRHVRLLAADLVFRLPFLGPLARKTGNTLAVPEDAERLLQQGELVGVFPEGYKGVGKGWRERYRLQRFGRGGFIELALKTGVPIVPVAIVGSEETYPMVADAKVLARLFGFPYFPITPFFPLLGPLGMIPLPSKWIIEFGEPIALDDHEPDAWQDAMLVFHLTDRIRDNIQQMLYRNLMSRRGVFF